MASSGLLITMMIEFGLVRAICSVTDVTILALVASKSSRLMPGLRGRPAVMTTTSLSWVAS
jgi:hypothetical protein